MHSRLDTSATAALFRMLQAGLGLSAVGLFANGSKGADFLAGTEAFGTLNAIKTDARTPQTRWRTAMQAVAQAPASGPLVRLAPELAGIPGAFAAIARVSDRRGNPVGFLVVADDRDRRLTPRSIACLSDAADLAATLIAAAKNAPLAGGIPDSPAGRVPRRAKRPSAILARADAHRIIHAALGGAREGRPASLLMLDLDRFQAVNKALGMAAGDALLAVTCARLECSLEDSEVLVRLEGDRFVMVAAREGRDLRALAGHILEAVSQPLSLAGQTLVMQASIGIVANVSASLSAQSVLLQADTALRRAKVEGRNRYVLHEPRLDAAVQERSLIELELANAPANGQMHLVYQPYIDLETGEASGVEALMRWNHPERGQILPNTFIPLAEATGLILPLGTWALRTACQQAITWPSHLVLSVNISALQFHQPSFTAQVDAALVGSGFPPERLELEITETVLMRDNPETIAQIEALIDRGIRIALDDFGTGYSALAYLARLPHHRIKLDHTFVQDLANPATAELIRAIIALAAANGVSITAEGIERPEQLDQVRAMGFTHAQGFAMGMPAANPAGRIAELCETPVA